MRKPILWKKHRMGFFLFENVRLKRSKSLMLKSKHMHFLSMGFYFQIEILVLYLGQGRKVYVENFPSASFMLRKNLYSRFLKIVAAGRLL